MELKTMLRVLSRIHNRVYKIDECIAELQASIYPKAQIISDMPRGGGQPRNSTEEYVEKIEYYKNEKKRLQGEATKLQEQIQAKLKSINATNDEMRLVDYKYNRCLSWAETAEAMQWTLGKCYYTYNRLMTKKMQKNIDNKVEM